MLKTRVMPCLLLRGRALMKTIRFKNANYIGDPVNTVRIYNEKEVDELALLDITATPAGKQPAFDLIGEIASECFMPLAYGGGLRRMEDIETLFNLGIEKAIINSHTYEDPDFIRRSADRFGSQSIVVSVDAKRSLLGRYEVYVQGGRVRTRRDPAEYALKMQEMGAGEILLTSIDRDGTMDGYDILLIGKVANAVTVPVIACGGARAVADFGKAVNKGSASAVAAGSMFVYQGRNRAVLINFPSKRELREVLE